MTEVVPIAARRSVRALLGGAIDYAGLFPPASLDMASAALNYDRYLASDDAWALGRFVVPVARLGELAGEAARGALWRQAPTDARWRLSAVVSGEVGGDAGRIATFNTMHAGVAIIDAVEARAVTLDQVRALNGVFAEVMIFVEIPTGDDAPSFLDAVRLIGASAKIRMGGTTPDAFPAPHDVARFTVACAERQLSFKATAGLHHPLRGEYRLTYADDSARGTMYGYLNVLLAAALARAGAKVADVEALLVANDERGLVIDDDALVWNGHTLSASIIAETRASLLLSFGSCSFREPLDELAAIRHA